MSELIIKWKASAAYRRQQASATGHVPAESQVGTFDLAAMTPEQREAILSLAYLHPNGLAELTISQFGNSYSAIPQDAPPTPASLAAYCTEAVSARRALATQKLAEKITECIAEISKHIAERNPATHFSPYISQADAQSANDLGLSLDAYRAAKQQLSELQPIFAAEKAAAQAEADANRAAAELAAQAKAAAELADRIAWANANGTERLQEGLAAGHRCDRLYEIERAAVDYPKFIVDWEKNAKWKDAVCPTLAALRERKTLMAAHPTAKIAIVWLIDQPLANKRDADYDYEPFEERQAIVVDDPAYTKYLVK